ncbi:MAG: HIT family protein [archaeon]
MPCVFCAFASGKRKKNTNGFPFIPLRETEKTLTFLATAFPAREDGHMLVIPKKHYNNITDIPPRLLAVLAQEVRLACAVLKKSHPGSNILLNNGSAAGQCIPHVHFHIIPRNRGDGIRIEVWKEKKLSEKKFVALSKKLAKAFHDL